ncbi:MAG: quinone-dependent dihydroorotate dehydrogenase [Pseudomonadota bacterium]
MLFKLAQPLLFGLDAERAHTLTLAGLKTGLAPRFAPAQDTRLAVALAGLSFPNPLGMAAGFDKDGEVPLALINMGFGHAELGTVTPRPQPGNPRPRVFRLPKNRGVINRYGFNSQGHAAVVARLQREVQPHRSGPQARGLVGVNLGANKDSEDFAADYVLGLKAFEGLADYFTINVSSPNTPGLRALQGKEPLLDLLKRVNDARPQPVGSNLRPPVFLKIAPDLSDEDMDTIAAALGASETDGLIVSNTTLSRSGTQGSAHANQAGGLSGAPLFERSTIVLARMRQRLPDTFPLIGVGGVASAEQAMAKIEAGASLVQVYTGLIYEGPGLVGSILRGMGQALDRTGVAQITDLVGTQRDAWASKALTP